MDVPDTCSDESLVCSVRFAGTDADVFIEICGTDRSGMMNSTARHSLASSQNNFERGAEDHFTVMYALGQPVYKQCQLRL